MRTGSDRENLYDEITNKIIAELEAGRIPWVQPWGTSAAKAPLGLPQNASTGRSYSGINVLILWGAVIEHGFPGQGWLTFRQALSLGGNEDFPFKSGGLLLDKTDRRLRIEAARIYRRFQTGSRLYFDDEWSKHFIGCGRPWHWQINT
ncbi:hypothetical protein AVM02_01395 [Brucella anthropi]